MNSSVRSDSPQPSSSETSVQLIDHIEQDISGSISSSGATVAFFSENKNTSKRKLISTNEISHDYSKDYANFEFHERDLISHNENYKLYSQSQDLYTDNDSQPGPSSSVTASFCKENCSSNYSMILESEHKIDSRKKEEASSLNNINEVNDVDTFYYNKNFSLEERVNISANNIGYGKLSKGYKGKGKGKGKSSKSNCSEIVNLNSSSLFSKVFSKIQGDNNSLFQSNCPLNSIVYGHRSSINEREKEIFNCTSQSQNDKGTSLVESSSEWLSISSNISSGAASYNDNCLVSSSTGPLDSLSPNFDSQNSPLSSSGLDSSMLESTIDSTCDQNLVSSFTNSSKIKDSTNEVEYCNEAIYLNRGEIAKCASIPVLQEGIIPHLNKLVQVEGILCSQQVTNNSEFAEPYFHIENLSSSSQEAVGYRNNCKSLNLDSDSITNISSNYLDSYNHNHKVDNSNSNSLFRDNNYTIYTNSLRESIPSLNPNNISFGEDVIVVSGDSKPTLSHARQINLSQSELSQNKDDAFIFASKSTLQNSDNDFTSSLSNVNSNLFIPLNQNSIFRVNESSFCDKNGLDLAVASGSNSEIDNCIISQEEKNFMRTKKSLEISCSENNYTYHNSSVSSQYSGSLFRNSEDPKNFIDFSCDQNDVPRSSHELPIVDALSHCSEYSKSRSSSIPDSIPSEKVHDGQKPEVPNKEKSMYAVSKDNSLYFHSASNKLHVNDTEANNICEDMPQNTISVSSPPQSSGDILPNSLIYTLKNGLLMGISNETFPKYFANEKEQNIYECDFRKVKNDCNSSFTQNINSAIRSSFATIGRDTGQVNIKAGVSSHPPKSNVTVDNHNSINSTNEPNDNLRTESQTFSHRERLSIQYDDFENCTKNDTCEPRSGDDYNASQIEYKQPVLKYVPSNYQEIDDVREDINSSDVDLYSDATHTSQSPKFWCTGCERVLDKNCSIHCVQVISKRPDFSRAWASLPSQYLFIKSVSTGNEDIFGVFTRKLVRKRCLFGPLEGRFVVERPRHSDLDLMTVQNGLEGYVDVGEEDSTNWMRFVRAAHKYSEINCVIIEEVDLLYFRSSVDIAPNTELRVSYSKQYARKYKLPLLSPDYEDSLRNDNNNESSSDIFQTRLKSRKRDKYHKLSGGDDDKNKEIRDIFECESCNLCFHHSEVFRIHKFSHVSDPVREYHIGIVLESADGQLNEDSLSCPLCSKVFTSVSELIDHSISHSFQRRKKNSYTRQQLKCQRCYKTFGSEERLENHLASHRNDNDKPFPCDRCFRRFSTKSALVSHHKLHSANQRLLKVYDCPICQEKFFTISTRKQHLASHCKDGEYTCPFCLKKFQFYQKIGRHINAYHSSSHPCEDCGKVFPSVNKLKNHLLSHSDRRDFACPVCLKRFKRKDKMKEHQNRIHFVNSKPHKNKYKFSEDKINIMKESCTTSDASCADTNKEQCDKDYVDKKKRNLKFIPKVDPLDYKQFTYKCQICFLGFKRRGMLVNHLSKRHPDVPISTIPELNQPISRPLQTYLCNHCGKSYRSSSKRKHHIMKQHPGSELPLPRASTGVVDAEVTQAFAVSCPLCPRQYATRAKLLQHQRRRHGSATTATKNESNKNEHRAFNSFVHTEGDRQSHLPSDDAPRTIELKMSHGTSLKTVSGCLAEAEEILVPPSLLLPQDGGSSYAVLTPESADTFTVSLRSGEQTLESGDTFTVSLRHGELVNSMGGIPVFSSIDSSATSGGLEPVNEPVSPQAAFTLDFNHASKTDGEGTCVMARVEPPNSGSVLVWQPSISFAPSS